MTGIFKEKSNNLPSYQGLTNTKLMGLVYTSGIASKLKLSSSTLNILLGLCFHYNTIREDSFPSQSLLSTKTGLSISSVKRAIKELLDKGLILKIKSTSSNSNKYYFTSKFFELVQVDTNTDQFDTTRVQIDTCMNEHENKTKRIKHSSYLKKHEVINPKTRINNDVSLNTSDLTEYKKVLITLEEWNYLNPKITIRRHGINKIKNLIELTKQKNPNNVGAYFRSLLNLQDDKLPKQQNECLKTDSNTSLKAINEIKQINEPRLSKQEIIQRLIQEGKIEESNTLIKLWRQ